MTAPRASLAARIAALFAVPFAMSIPVAADEAQRMPTPTFIASPEETIVASAVVTDEPYSADNTGGHDATAAIQKALDAVARVNGGVVFVPAGRYRIDGSLELGYGTTLMGDWQHPDRGGIGKGTILLAYGGCGDESAPPLIQLTPHRETALRNISVWYPEQEADDIRPYPFTIEGGTCTTPLAIAWEKRLGGWLASTPTFTSTSTRTGAAGASMPNSG